MKPEQINIAITEFLNPTVPKYTVTEIYEDDPHWNSGFYESTITFSGGVEVSLYDRKDNLTPEKIKLMWLSEKNKNYYNNLNLMHEAEEVFVQHDGCVWGKDWDKYCKELANVCFMAEPANCLCRATAAQRAEAFLKVFNLWKE